ncbi:hypothetical protein Tco_0572773 [Tanacetum coccineum]
MDLSILGQSRPRLPCNKYGADLVFNVASPNKSLNGSSINNGSDQVDNTPDNVVSLSYRTKLRPTSFTMANLRKLKANVPNDADYEIWLPLYLVDEFFWFLGTIARNASYAPLTYNSWPKVPNKEMMWKYVLGKYIVPDNAKSWELTTIRDCWRKKIRNYNPPKHESAPTHPFLAVMNKEYDGHCRLFGRGVTNTLIKKGQSADMVRDLEANYERRMSGLKEDHARKLDAMQQKNDDDREKLIEDVMRKILGKLLIEVVCYIASTKIIANEGCVSTGFTDYIPMQNTTTPICEPSKFADGTSKGTADQDMTINQNGSEQVDNTLVNVVPPSYATKLRPTSSIMANIQKLKANVPNDADYDVRCLRSGVGRREEEEEDDEEDVEIVFDESSNLIQNTKAGGSSSFTAAVG